MHTKIIPVQVGGIPVASSSAVYKALQFSYHICWTILSCVCGSCGFSRAVSLDQLCAISKKLQVFVWLAVRLEVGIHLYVHNKYKAPIC